MAPSSKPGFTIIEVLVAIAVLSLLIIFVAQMAGNINAVSNQSRKLMDAESEARLIFDRIGSDLHGMIKRNDVDFYFSNTPSGDDEMYFYSEAPGYADASASSSNAQSSIALVGYKIITTAGSSTSQAPAYRIERLGKTLSWNVNGGSSSGVSPVFLTWTNSPLTYTNVVQVGSTNSVIANAPLAPSTFLGAWSSYAGMSASNSSGVWSSSIGSSYTSQNNTSYRVFGAQTFRFKVAYQTPSGQWTYQPNEVPVTHTLNNITAISVSIAVLDGISRKMLNDTQLAALAGALVKADSTPNELQQTHPLLPAQAWQQAINIGGFAEQVGIPAAAAAQIRVYQRIFYLREPSSN